MDADLVGGYRARAIALAQDRYTRPEGLTTAPGSLAAAARVASDWALAMEAVKTASAAMHSLKFMSAMREVKPAAIIAAAHADAIGARRDRGALPTVGAGSGILSPRMSRSVA